MANLRKRAFLLFRILIILALIIGFYWAWLTLKNPDIFPIKTVEVQASYKHIDKITLGKIILPYVSQGFFNLNIEQLQQQLLQMPWIENVEVNRIWPATVHITVSEQQAVARWGNNALINAQGVIFNPAPDTFPNNLPVLTGDNPTQVKQLWNDYQQMTTILSPIGLHIAELDMDARQALTLILTNGAQILLGQENALAHLQRFVSVYPKIFTNPSLYAKSVDLRYDHGMAIHWQKKS